jgi:hypothetical protein
MEVIHIKPQMLLRTEVYKKCLINFLSLGICSHHYWQTNREHTEKERSCYKGTTRLRTNANWLRAPNYYTSPLLAHGVILKVHLVSQVC